MGKVINFVKGLFLLGVILTLILVIIVYWPDDDSSIPDSVADIDTVDETVDDEITAKINDDDKAVEGDRIMTEMFAEVNNLNYDTANDVVSSLERVFNDFAVIEYHENLGGTGKNVFKVIPSQVDFVRYLSDVMDGHHRDDYARLEGGLLNMSKVIDQQLGPNYVIVITPAFDTEQTLVTISNGVVVQTSID